MKQRKSCPLSACVSEHSKGRFIPKWGIRMCVPCREAHPSGLAADVLPDLLALGVSEGEIMRSQDGQILIPPFSEAGGKAAGDTPS